MTRRQHTPLYIEIGLHYFCSTAEFPRLDAPACQDAVRAFVSAGLLRQTNGAHRKYEPTDGLTEWVDRLCAVPWPVQTWVAPQ